MVDADQEREPGAGGAHHLHRPAWRPWDVALALAVLIALYALISSQLRVGPVWLLPVLVVGLFAALVATHRSDRHEAAHLSALAIAAVGTLAVQGSVGMLVKRLLDQDISALNLLRDAAMLWLANVIVFGLWYWQLDGNGPYHRHTEGYQPTDLAFPQIQLGGDFAESWSPTFTDYLFVAFTASAAFSSTDTSFLSVRAKLLMMVQAISSLIILAVVAARAINIIG